MQTARKPVVYINLSFLLEGFSIASRSIDSPERTTRRTLFPFGECKRACECWGVRQSSWKRTTFCALFSRLDYQPLFGKWARAPPPSLPFLAPQEFKGRRSMCTVSWENERSASFLLFISISIETLPLLLGNLIVPGWLWRSFCSQLLSQKYFVVSELINF